jgi:integrase
VDTPKTTNSIREVALPDGLLSEIEAWRKVSIDTQPKAWVFASEKLTPLSRDNCWRRHIGPKLKEAGLGWATFQVMRRTHSSLLNDLNVHPKVVADQLGHTVDVNQNVYTKTGLGRRTWEIDIRLPRLSPLFSATHPPTHFRYFSVVVAERNLRSSVSTTGLFGIDFTIIVCQVA